MGFVLIWAIKNGNNIKFKKKEKKKKDKSANNFKDVVPKEKPDKKVHKEKVRAAVKAEKSGEAMPPSNKVVKVTKEDFSNSDLVVPKSMEDKNVEEKSNEIFKKEFDEKFDDNFDLEKEMRALGISMPESASIMDDQLTKDFLAPMSGGLPDECFKDDFTDFDFNDDFSDLPFGKDDIFEIKGEDNSTMKPGKFEEKSISERMAKVFGESGFADETTKEIIVGSVMLGNRSRTNRENRERRNKWLK